MKTKTFVHYLNKNSTIGGIEVYTSRLVKLLDEKGINSLFIFKSDEVFENPLDDGCKISWSELADLDKGSTRIICHHLPEQTELEKMQGFSKSYFVHDHYSYCIRQHKYHLLGRKTCHLAAGLKCIACTLGLQKLNGKISMINSSEPFTRLKALKSFNHFLVLSNTIRDYLITNGIDNKKIFEAPVLIGEHPKTEVNLSKTRNALFLGQLIYGKGVSQLPEIAQKSTAWNFKAVGHGNLYDSLKHASKNAANLEITGFLNKDKLDEVFAWADVLVMPTYWQEPFGLVGLEANCRNLPVLAYNIGGITGIY